MQLWAKFAGQDLDKLEDLIEALILDIRSREKLDWEQEALIRFGYQRLTDVISGCRAETEQKIRSAETQKQKQTQKQKLRKII